MNLPGIRPLQAAGAARETDLQALRALSELTLVLAEEHNPEKLLERSLGTMIRLAVAQSGLVRVVTSDGAHLRLVASQGLTPEVVAQEQLVPLDCGVCGAAVGDDAVRQSFELQHCAAQTGSDYFRSVGTALVVPLRHMGRVLGAYTLFFDEQRDTPEELGLLFRSISEHLGMALENTRLLRENMRMTLMSERQLIANEVHDSLAQTMAYMKIRLAMMQEALEANEQQRALKHTNEVQQALDDAYADLRELLSQFRNRMDPLGLVHALQEMRGKFHDRTGITLAFDNRTTDLDLSVEEESQVFHIMQEALANVARHSGAKRAKLTMELAGGEYRFAIEDDGLGFYAFGQRLGGAEQHTHLRHHLGVNIMRERAQRLNGAIEIVNLPQGGARVSLVFPARGTQA
ncbi:MAG: GAF domain-containing protein [Burkholderiales bacterium]|nr:GAF domain-containing protein [Burkholderiales bacterium]